MSTNDVSNYEVKCPCGSGKVSVTYSIPDHAYARESQASYEFQWQCSSCENMYVIKDRGDFFLKSELLAEKDARAKYRSDCEAIEKMPEFQSMCIELETRLDKLPSKAERYRKLFEAGLISESQSKFTRNWRDGRQWVESHFTPNLIKKLEIKNTALANASKSLASADAAITRAVPKGNLLHSFSRR